MHSLLISVVIPAYNEEKRIGQCLKSIFSQNLPQEKFEVIVVDNNSTDKTPSIVKKDFPQARLVRETKQGTVFARIRGVEEAKAEIVAMTDADAVYPRQWLSKFLKAYENPKVVAVAGTSDFEYKNTGIKLCQFLINHFNLLFKTFPGHNMSFRKDAYFQVGGFSTKINLGEDFYLSVKLKRVGEVIVLSDNPVVPSSRRFFDGFFSYASKYTVNVFSILIFDKPIFFKFKAVRQKAEAALNYLKDEYR